MTDEQLEAAYRAVAHRSWPDLHELKLAAARFKLVEGYAQRRSSGAFTAVAAEQQQAQAKTRALDRSACTATPPPRATLPALPNHPAVFDHKRAASGEREDD